MLLWLHIYASDNDLKDDEARQRMSEKNNKTVKSSGEFTDIYTHTHSPIIVYSINQLKMVSFRF